jgi:carboxyl-terminal processing protease
MILMKKKFRIILYVLISIVIFGIVFSFGMYFGYSNRSEVEKLEMVINKEPLDYNTKENIKENKTDFSPFWKAWNILNDKSIYVKNVTDQEKVWGAISGLAASVGDPYTVFFPPEENKLFSEDISGSFSGIGAEIGIKDKILTVISPMKDSPSFRAGLKAGDKILKINGESTSNITIDKALSLIRGEKDTAVTLTALSEGEKATKEIKIIRDIISVPVIDTQDLGDGIFLIKFYSFSEKSASLFKKALKEFIDSGNRKLVLDLRGNPGGYLNSAVDIASWFLDEGKTIVSEDFEGNRDTIVYRSHGPKVFNNLPFVILVNGGSASASEILAGALQEHGIAKIVGEKTFGKGSVQELVNITDNTSIKVTVAKWITPNGKSLSSSGLDPDFVVPITIKDIESGKDPQLEKAIELLKNKN